MAILAIAIGILVTSIIWFPLGVFIYLVANIK